MMMKEDRAREALNSSDLEAFPWYQIGMQKDAALRVLAHGKPGDFVLRDSESMPDTTSVVIYDDAFITIDIAADLRSALCTMGR